MFRNGAATEPSGESLGLPIEDQIREKDQIRETSVVNVRVSSRAPIIPSSILSTSAQPASVIRRSPPDATYRTQVQVDELSEDIAQSAHLPFDDTDASRLSPLPVLVRPPSQSQPNVRATSFPVSQNAFIQVPPVSIHTNSTAAPQGNQQLPSQNSHEWYRVPTARTSGDIPTSFLGAREAPDESLDSNQHATRFQRVPIIPFMYPGTPPQSYKGQGVESVQPHPPGPKFIPQSPPSRSYNTPNVPTPQAQLYPPGPFIPQLPPSRSYTIPNPTPQAESFIPQASGPHFGHDSSRQPFSAESHFRPKPSSPDRYYNHQTVGPQTSRKVNVFVASDPFQASHGNKKVDASSDGLTFDDIPMPAQRHGALPSWHRFGRIIPDTAPHPVVYPGSQPWGVPESSNQPQLSYDPPSEGRGDYTSRPERNANPPSNGSPEPSNQPHIPYNPSVFGWSDFDFGREQNSTQPVVSNFPAPVPEVPILPDLPMPSTQHADIIGPEVNDAITALPVGNPSSPSHSEYTPHEPQKEANQTPFEFYIPDSSQYQYPDLRKESIRKSICSRLAYFFRCLRPTHSEANLQPVTVIYPPTDSGISYHEAALKFVMVTAPKQIYLHLLLRLPSLYFSRVSRIFEEADMTLPQIKKMALELASHGRTYDFEMEMDSESPTIPLAYKKLTSTWEFFIDSVMREWKTFNVVSVLLLTAILTTLQIESAAEDPVTRYTALISLLCALISLLFGCIYIVRFGTMRKSYKAAEWALEAKKTTLIWWNIWVLLAMPAIWLAWSIMLYITCIMSFIWRSGVTSTTPPGISDTGLLTVRVVITVILGIGVLYGILIMSTLRRYGTVMDKEWKKRIDDWIEEKSNRKPESLSQPAPPYPFYRSFPDHLTMYQPPTYGSTPYYPHYFNEANGRHSGNTYAPMHPPDAYVSPVEPVLPEEPSLKPNGLHHGTSSSTDTITRVNTFLNHSPNLQNPDMTSAEHTGTAPPLRTTRKPFADTPSPLLQGQQAGTTSAPQTLEESIVTEETPRRLVWTDPPITPVADRSSKDEDNALGLSSELEKGVGER